MLAIPAGWGLKIFGKRLPQHFDAFAERLRQSPRPWIRKRVLTAALALMLTGIAAIQWGYSATVEELNDGNLWTGILFQSIDSARDLRQVGRMKQLRSIQIRGACAREPADLAPLGTLPLLERVELRFSPLAVPGLACLAHSPALREVMVEEWGGFETNLKFAGNLTQLEVLKINTCDSLTDASLHSLRNLTQLRELRLPNGQNVTDDGLKSLAGLTRLRSFQCGSLTRITDDGLSALKEWKELERLDLAECSGISGSGFESLHGLTALQHLTVPKTIEDEGLKEVVRAMPQLEELHLNDWEIRKIRRALPNCQIEIVPNCRCDD